MSNDAKKAMVRMRFQLSWEENPLLTQELIGARAGRSRHARLLTLASLGLMAERQMGSVDGTRGVAKPSEPRKRKGSGSGQFSDNEIAELEGSFGGGEE